MFSFKRKRYTTVQNYNPWPELFRVGVSVLDKKPSKHRTDVLSVLTAHLQYRLELDSPRAHRLLTHSDAVRFLREVSRGGSVQLCEDESKMLAFLRFACNLQNSA